MSRYESRYRIWFIYFTNHDNHPLDIMMLMFCSPGWVEAGVEDDSKMVSEIEEAEDISGNSAFGPQTPSSPSTPLTISQSHKKS